MLLHDSNTHALEAAASLALVDNLGGLVAIFHATAQDTMLQKKGGRFRVEVSSGYS